VTNILGNGWNAKIRSSSIRQCMPDDFGDFSYWGVSFRPVGGWQTTVV